MIENKSKENYVKMTKNFFVKKKNFNINLQFLRKIHLKTIFFLTYTK